MSAIRNLRFIGIAEGISFLVLLLIAMPLKSRIRLPKLIDDFLKYIFTIVRIREINATDTMNYANIFIQIPDKTIFLTYAHLVYINSLILLVAISD